MYAGRGLSRTQGAEERSVGKRQEPARQLGKMPYRDVPLSFQAAAGLSATPVESEALAVVVARCMQHAHGMQGRLSLGPARTHNDACTSDGDGEGGRHESVWQVMLCTRAKRERRSGHSATATKPTIKAACEGAGCLAVPHGA